MEVVGGREVMREGKQWKVEGYGKGIMERGNGGRIEQVQGKTIPAASHPSTFGGEKMGNRKNKEEKKDGRGEEGQNVCLGLMEIILSGNNVEGRRKKKEETRKEGNMRGWKRVREDMIEIKLKVRI